MKVETDPLGYKVTLDRPSADQLLAALEDPATDGALALSNAVAKMVPIASQAKLLVAVITADIQLFRARLKEKRGDHGVLIDVWGLKTNPARKDWRSEIAYSLLPSEWQARIDAAMTIPIYWTIDPIN